MSLTLTDWQTIVAIVVSALGLIATLYTAFGSTARRLRNDLTIDVKLVTELQGHASEDLQESVTERSHRLVAATKYPILTGYEIALTLIIGGMFWLLFSLPGSMRTLAEQGEVTFELSGLGQVIVLLITFVSYAAAVRSWSGRAAARVNYLYKRLGDDEARSLVRLLAFPAWLVPVSFVLTLSIGMLLNITAIFKALDWSLGVAILVTTAVTMLMAWLAIVIAARENFSEHVRFYTDPMHMGSDIPRLRPLDLGQTEEDRVHYKEATARRFPERRRKRDK
ncbi:hypothetical protein MT344_15105 [Clavibacter michiganensis subsp. phaseoli]|uniref:hypothetical protein n=1 Tax=Clavibacter phaseoli TaxID=1734031 RepID=UPI001FB227A9|nr:hypothetical protein [Clavibacter phaseoli]MCJ1712508.1 hypothetical protein [Clavibacter phaseoli]